MNKSESKYFNTAALMDKAFLELLNTKDFEYITVKEICQKAGVNRSTFYLHYETIGDLLDESIEFMNREFNSYFEDNNDFKIDKIGQEDIEKLFLITPQYLLPYLKYVKENKRFYKTAIEKSKLLGSQGKFDSLFQNIISPIMERYKIPQEKRIFILTFYIEGIIGTIKLWLKNDCKEDVAFISEIISSCVIKPI